MSRQHRIAPLSAPLRRALIAGVAVLLGFGLAGFERTALAQQRIVVTPYSGSGGGRIASATEDVLKQAGHTIVPFQAYRNAARDLDARGPVSANVARVGGAVEFDVVLFGEVKRARGGRAVTVQVFARDGQELGTLQFRAKRRRLDRGERAEVRAQLLPIIERLGGASPAPLPPEPEPEPEPEIIDEGGDDGLVMEPDPVTDEAADLIEMEGEGGAAETGTSTGSGVEQVSDTESAFTPGELKRAPSTQTQVEQNPATSTRGPLNLSVGLGTSFRTLDATGAERAESYTYEGNSAGPYINAELYPAGFAGDSVPASAILSNIGIQFDFYQAIGLNSDVPYVAADNSEQEANLNNTLMEFGVGLTYRYFFGDAPNPPTVKLGVAYRSLTFTFDNGDMQVPAAQLLADVTYDAIAPALAVRVPLGRALALSAQGRLLVLLDEGDISTQEQLGDTSSALGFDVGAGIEYEFIPRLSARLGFRFADITLAFEENGMIAGVDGTTDTYLGGQFTVGYRY